MPRLEAGGSLHGAHKTKAPAVATPPANMLDDRKRSAKRVQVAPQGWRSIRANERGIIEVPPGYGLLMRLDGREVVMETVVDHHASAIHPNCYIPASFSDLHVLKGGGSGAAVFAGSHPILKKVVMKHAGAKDTREVLSLAEIDKEFQRRDAAAAAYLRKRIPGFAFLYISPYHVRDRSQELCSTIRADTLQHILRNHQDAATHGEESDEESADFSPCKGSIHPGKVKRQIFVHRGEPMGIEVLFSRVFMHVPSFSDTGRIAEGHDFLNHWVDHLEQTQKEHYWKITVGQNQIGGPSSENGAMVLTAGRLKGGLLAKTIQEYTAVLQNLRALTLPEEKDVLEACRQEVTRLTETRNVASISKTLDQFVGSAILKNFAPKTGRLAMLRAAGRHIREGTLILTAEEEEPAKLLGRLLDRGVSLATVFAQEPSFPSALDLVEDSWLGLLQLATSFDDHASTNRIWTAGLTDAGLHNSFVSLDRGLELFDLGIPQYMPEPAFLTKFNMSFFHAFGMEDNGKGDWVQRFECVRSSGRPPRVCLTRVTKVKIASAYEGFRYAVDFFVDRLFHQDAKAAELMVRYSVLQLVSDAAFCLNRWQMKGGGKEHFGSNPRPGSKWLWRAIWDIYISSEVCDRLLPKHEKA